jgi:HEAT repeat protein
MSRSALKLAVLFAISYLGFVGYSYLMHAEPAASAATREVQAVNGQQDEVQRSSIAQGQANSTQAADPEVVTPEVVDRWLKQAADVDPAIRAAAIAALVKAPRSQAVPVLLKILDAGEPNVDRPLALRSLAAIALQQGDADAQIRDAIRHEIYHTDDSAMVLAEQAVLDDIEGHLSKGTPSAVTNAEANKS